MISREMSERLADAARRLRTGARPDLDGEADASPDFSSLIPVPKDRGQDALLIAAYQETGSAKGASEKTGIALSTATRRLKFLGYSRPLGCPRKKDASDHKVRETFLATGSISETARRLDLCFETTRQRLIRMGLWSER